MEISLCIAEIVLHQEIKRLTYGTLITHRYSTQQTDTNGHLCYWVTFTPNTQQEAMTLVLRAYDE